MVDSTNKTTSLDEKLARQLIFTAQGQKWLSQFDPFDQEAAKLLARSLTLVSHIEFRRNLESLIIEQAKDFEGPIGLYAVRELKRAPDDRVAWI